MPLPRRRFRVSPASAALLFRKARCTTQNLSSNDQPAIHASNGGVDSSNGAQIRGRKKLEILTSAGRCCGIGIPAAFLPVLLWNRNCCLCWSQLDKNKKRSVFRQLPRPAFVGRCCSCY